MVARTAKFVRPYRPENAAELVQIHNRAFPADQMRPLSFARYLNDVLNIEGQVWTISAEQGLVGYGYVTPVPGLEDVFDLQGCIDPAQRRQGFGSHLLNEILNEMQANGRYQLSHAVYSLAAPTALFLQSHQFVVEHVEWQLLLENPGRLPPVSFPPGFRPATYPLPTAVRTFRKLYDAIFRGLPWYQPYTSTKEVTADLSDAADLLFLVDGEKAAGFAWLRMPEPDVGEVEPFGLLPTYQGRGLGVQFLTAAVHQLAAQGAEQVRIGAWQRNERAIHLYQQVGFKHINTQTYLAFTFGSSQT